MGTMSRSCSDVMFAVKGICKVKMLRHSFSLNARSDGSSLLEAALVMPVLILLLAVAVDAGRAYYLAIEVSSAAHAGAIYGAQNPGDTSGMVSAAKLEAPDISILNATATYGCECHDGSSNVAGCTTPPTCADNYVNYADVATSAVYAPIFPYPGLSTSLTLRGYAAMRSGGD
jgi:Flp pilus assembly protein TadG